MWLRATILYSLLLLLSFRSLVSGEVTIIVTLTFYFSLLLLVHVLLKGFSWLFNKQSSIHQATGKVRLMAFSVIVVFLVSDLSLLHLIRPERYLTYPERNGQHTYYTFTLRQKFEPVRPYLGSRYKMRWPFTNKPNTVRNKGEGEFSYTHKFNTAGLRDAVVPGVKKKNEIRLLALGDSFTEGVGAPEDSTWSFLLNQLLNRNSPDTFFTTTNAGVSGSDPFFQSNLLQTNMLKHQPDVVFVAINMSDIDEVMQRGGYERFRKDSTYVIRNSPWWEPVYGASIIFRMWMHNVFHYTHYLMTVADEQRLRKESKPRLMEAVNELIRLSEENKFKLVFIFHPVLSELEQNYFPLAEIVTRIKETERVSVINLYKDYKTYFKGTGLKMSDYYWAKDLHHNSKGYQLWSELVYAELKEKKVFN